jgi:hypothetical protein
MRTYYRKIYGYTCGLRETWLSILTKVCLIFSPWLYSPWRTLAASHIGGFLSYLDIWYDSLNEWSARRKASTYTGQHNTERRGQTSVPWAGFEPTIPATNRPRPTPQTSRPEVPSIILFRVYLLIVYLTTLTQLKQLYNVELQDEYEWWIAKNVD